MPTYRDEAVVLRTHKLGEADRIITMLGYTHGKFRAVGRGVRRTSSRIGARLEPFMVVDVQCYTGRTLDTVSQVETTGPYARPICDDYAAYTAAAAMCEAADRLVDEGQPAVQQFWLLKGALKALADGEHPAPLVLDSYLMRAFGVAGWAPSLLNCARCGAPGPHAAFSVPLGGAVCPACRPPGSAALSPDAFTLLGALISGDWPTAESQNTRTRAEASGLIAAFTQYHLERSLRSLKHVDRT
ncbi:MAG: DNA repair protein RecO [Cellulomonadaceae bacterium]|jgi:DNA repair protein RecO (recombination protein O)|nr:DNA repair protein RecO [Cellulomonadaceae bacterium]